MVGKCAVWPTEMVEIGRDANLDLDQYNSPRAGGNYAIAPYLLGTISLFNDTQRARLTTWLVDQHRSGIACPTVTAEALNELNSHRALRISDKKRRFFEALVSMKFGLGNWVDFFGQAGQDEQHTICAWTECENQAELIGLQRFLKDEGLIVQDGPGYRLTSRGYTYLEQAEIGGANSKQAFVAMWFDSELTVAYDLGIALAIKESGFEPFRIDRKEHINKIDDEIIAEIRRSRFVVADFTCGLIDIGDKKQAQARGGVYYEAGFAQGLGTPVIWTVRKDCVDHVHFDTRQFAHIVWDNPADLFTKLLNRIRATIPGSA